ncbi:hypothetical protein [Burkholderia ubonensis]|uniref:hypothetical protein n=1 Tax=Burkholderia ubonensis TaxID=101571 RepID=UPI001056A2F0|nr:hypothetical protein [Burkholderia ubonensis]
MGWLQKILLGTAPKGADGDSSRVAHIKANANVDVLNAQAALTSAPLIAASQVLTDDHIGKRVNLSFLTDGGFIKLKRASTCLPDSVVLLVNVGVKRVALAVDDNSGDALALTGLSAGESALVDTDGVHTWRVLLRGRAAGDNESVVGNLNVGGSANFAQRPSVNGATVWDSGNLADPLVAHDNLKSLENKAIARGNLGVSHVLLGKIVCDGKTTPEFVYLFSDEFKNYEVEWEDVVHPNNVVSGSDQLWMQVHVGGSFNGYDASPNYQFAWSFMNSLAQMAIPPSSASGGVAFQIYNGQAGGYPFGSSGRIRIYNPMGLVAYRRVTWEAVGNNGSGMAMYWGGGAYVGGVGMPVDGVRLVLGNGAAPGKGVFRLYGIRA